MARFRANLLFRISLLALLALGWATVPHLGQLPFSTIFSGQLVVDETIGIRPGPWNRVEETFTDGHAIPTIHEWTLPSDTFHLFERDPCFFSSRIMLIYFFMSIRR